MNQLDTANFGLLLLDFFYFLQPAVGRDIWASQTKPTTTGADGLDETNFPNAKKGTPITLHPRTLTRFSFFPIITNVFFSVSWSTTSTQSHTESPRRISYPSSVQSPISKDKTKLIGL